jgi:hypothetical protein
MKIDRLLRCIIADMVAPQSQLRLRVLDQDQEKAMKVLFFAINLIIGIVGLVLGVASITSVFGASHNYYAVALIGLGLLAMAGICLCFCGDCVCLRKKQDRLAA